MVYSVLLLSTSVICADIAMQPATEAGPGPFAGGGGGCMDLRGPLWPGKQPWGRRCAEPLFVLGVARCLHVLPLAGGAASWCLAEGQEDDCGNGGGLGSSCLPAMLSVVYRKHGEAGMKTQASPPVTSVIASCALWRVQDFKKAWCRAENQEDDCGNGGGPGSSCLPPMLSVVYRKHGEAGMKTQASPQSLRSLLLAPSGRCRTSRKRWLKFLRRSISSTT